MFRSNKLLILLAIIMLFAFSTPVFAAPTVTLDGQQMSFEVPPVTDNGRTLVPLRAIFEAMGATVTWDKGAQSATAIKGGTTVILPLASTSPTINGQVKTLDVPAKAINGSILAPLRFVGEAFGGTVIWNQDTQLITILSVPGSGSVTALPTISQIMVHFIDVGQADSIYIELPNHNDILIDGGNVGDGQTVVDYLKARGVDDIELLIATHPHEDHIGGLPDVMNAFKVEKIIDSGKTATSGIYNSYAAAAKTEGCTWEQDNQQTLNWGNVALQIMTANETWGDVNDYSVVSRLDCGDIEFLLTGDAETPVEKTLAGDISADVLKVGGHGSTSSSSASFISLVKPQVAVISVGTGNTYGYPAAETLSKLQTAGAKVYRTDLNGNIVVSTDGKTYSVRSEKDKPTPTVTVPANQVPTQVKPGNTSTTTDSGFPTNEYGQTYGSSANCSLEQEPDLVKAIGVDGTAGYVLSKDLNGEMPKTPEEAIAMMKAFPAEGKIIPLYAVDGKTVIGEFRISAGKVQEIK